MLSTWKGEGVPAARNPTLASAFTLSKSRLLSADGRHRLKVCATKHGYYELRGGRSGKHLNNEERKLCVLTLKATFIWRLSRRGTAS